SCLSAPRSYLRGGDERSQVRSPGAAGAQDAASSARLRVAGNHSVTTASGVIRLDETPSRWRNAEMSTDCVEWGRMATCADSYEPEGRGGGCSLGASRRLSVFCP